MWNRKSIENTPKKRYDGNNLQTCHDATSSQLKIQQKWINDVDRARCCCFKMHPSNIMVILTEFPYTLFQEKPKKTKPKRNKSRSRLEGFISFFYCIENDDNSVPSPQHAPSKCVISFSYHDIKWLDIAWHWWHHHLPPWFAHYFSFRMLFAVILFFFLVRWR